MFSGKNPYDDIVGEKKCLLLQVVFWPCVCLLS